MFSGRTLELKTLERLRLESSRHLRAVLVHGPAGIGKTSLMREFSRRVGEKGAEVIWGRLHENVDAGPFRIWIQAITDWVRHRGAGAPLPDSPEALSAVRTIEDYLPELGGLFEAPGSSPSGRRRSASGGSLPQALAELICTALASRPTVVILEDIHLAAGGSIEVLAALIHRAEVPLFVCATSRAPSVGGLDGAANLATIALSRFGPEDVRRICLQSVPELSEETIRRVYELTQGDPLLVAEASEVIRIEGSQAHGRRGRIEGWEHRVTERLLPLYKRRVRSLPEEERSVLLYAAALGPVVDEVRLAACLAAVTDESIRCALSTGVAFGLLEHGGSGESGYRFPSELVRQTLLGIIDAPERARIHGSIARLLASTRDDGSERHAAELQSHYLRSGTVPDIRRGIEWALAAGSRAMEAHRWSSSTEIFERLLSEHGTDLTSDEAAEARYGLGRSLLHSGRKMEAVGYLRTALESFERSEEPERIVEVARQIISYEIGDVEYFAIVEAAMKVVPPDASVHDSLAFFYGVGQMEALGDYAAAWETLSAQLRRARATHSARAENAALAALAYIDVRFSRLDDAIEKCNLVIERCRKLDDPFAYIHGAFVLMQAHLARGETPAASRLIWSAKEPTIAMGDNVLIAGWYAMVVRFELRAGNWDAARTLCRDGLAYDPDSPVLLPLCTTLEHETGNLEEGDRFLDRLIRSVSAYPAGPYLAYASTALAIMGRWSAYGDKRWVPVAREIAEMMLTGPAPPAVVVRALMVRGLGALCEADRQLARDSYRRLKSAPRLNLVRDYRVELVLARLASANGNRAQAAAHFEAAISDATSYADRPALAWIHYYRGEMLMDASGDAPADATAARGALDRALRLGGELEMPPVCSLCRDMLSRIDRRTNASRGAAPAPSASSILSEREHQVLRLLAEGMADKEIAAILGLSVYTVSNHVRHILRKIDAPNRVGAVNVARRAGAL